MWQTLRRSLPGKHDASARGKPDLAALVARAPTVASVVLGLAIAGQAAGIVLSLSADIAAGTGGRARFPIDGQMNARHQAQLNNIAAAHLFGAAPQAMTVQARAVDRSPLVLTGIIATSDPHVGYAIVGTSPESTKTIYVGREAEPGTVLAEVYPQWIVLQRGSERLTLRLLRKDAAGSAGGRVGFALARAAPQPQDDGEPDGKTPLYLPPPPISDGAAVLRSFSLRRTMVDGQQGERIGGSSLNGKVLAALSLSPGDVIVQINGVPVGGPNTPDLMTVLQSGNATLMVVKDGQETSVTIDPNSMAGAAAIFRQTQPDL